MVQENDIKQGQITRKTTAYLAETLTEGNKTEGIQADRLKELIKEQINEILAAKETMNNTNMVYFDDFVGNIPNTNALNKVNHLNTCTWIVDTEATNHMCCCFA